MSRQPGQIPRPPTAWFCVAASLLLLLWTGQRPNRRMVESLQWYWMGLATQEDLVTLLQRAAGAKKS